MLIQAGPYPQCQLYIIMGVLRHTVYRPHTQVHHGVWCGVVCGVLVVVQKVEQLPWCGVTEVHT